IGARAAVALGRRGARLVLAARREDRLREIANRIRDRGGPGALVVPTDVTKVGDLRALAERVRTEAGRCDVLVNNAGIPGGGAFADLSLAHLERVTATNYLSVLRLTKLLLPMLADAGGHVVNVASLAGRFAVPGAAAYTASKHAVVALSEALYHELAPRGVMVTSVNPGFVHTEGFPHRELQQDPRLRRFVMGPSPTVRAIVEVIEGRRGPEVSVPRWIGPLQAFRILTPPLYRAAVRRLSGRRTAPPDPSA
ncbi:MAG TPA: SDR family NAD(P)-dependent oxidoreductase, partial [Actinomycetota bacterium]|nr:SDR family NAD(P)-dependent oxidoreductase [Actinomycetota bacterium]